MEILAFLVSLVTAVLAVAAFLRARRRHAEERQLRVSRLQKDVLGLIEELRDLHNQVERRFTQKYRAQLKRELDEEQYEKVDTDLLLLKTFASEKFLELSRIVNLELLQIANRVNPEEVLVQTHALLTRQCLNARELLDSRLVGGVFRPTDRTYQR